MLIKLFCKLNLFPRIFFNVYVCKILYNVFIFKNTAISFKTFKFSIIPLLLSVNRVESIDHM